MNWKVNKMLQNEPEKEFECCKNIAKHSAKIKNSLKSIHNHV